MIKLPFHQNLQTVCLAVRHLEASKMIVHVAVLKRLRGLPGLQAILPRSQVGIKVKGENCAIDTKIRTFSEINRLSLIELC